MESGDKAMAIVVICVCGVIGATIVGALSLLFSGAAVCAVAMSGRSGDDV